jgi:hypothetical protein
MRQFFFLANQHIFQYLNNIQIDLDENWMIVGDFNFYKSLEDRNREGTNYSAMETFNSIIGHPGLIEIPLKGRRSTWSIMQGTPLLEQLNWCFTSLA